MAAGVGALVWTVEPLLTPDQVEARLFSGCVDLGSPGNDVTWGWGRVNSYSSVLPVANPIPAVSDWGMAVMTLLVLTAGTLVYMRRRPPARVQ